MVSSLKNNYELKKHIIKPFFLLEINPLQTKNSNKKPENQFLT